MAILHRFALIANYVCDTFAVDQRGRIKKRIKNALTQTGPEGLLGHGAALLQQIANLPFAAIAVMQQETYYMIEMAVLEPFLEC